MFRCLATVLALATLAASSATEAFIVHSAPTTVVEFKNVDLNHYFLTADPEEIAAIDAGAAGAGWYRTGFGFGAYVADVYPCNGCQTVARFYGTPGLGPNSHFFTAGAEEAAGLKQPGSGWSFEKIAFQIEVPDAAGACRAGLTPVYRVYNNRWMFNDSNHRYVTDAGERAAMIAAGWADEGARFCSPAAVDITLKKYDIVISEGAQIQPGPQCEDESARVGSCLAVNNLPVPDRLVGQFSRTDAYVLANLSGHFSFSAYSSRPDVGAGPAAMDIMARSTFVQAGGLFNGIHLDTRERGAFSYSSVNPLYQFRTQAGSGGADERLFPWRAAGPFETELSVTGSFKVVRLVAGEGSHAFGYPMLVFIDLVSGRHLYLTIQAYGTDVSGDFVAPVAPMGQVIVGTAMVRGGTPSPFGRTVAGSTFHILSGYTASYNDLSQQFDFRVNRTEFQRMLDAARAYDPALSPDADDYIVDNVRFTNEVVGDGEIGVGQNLSLQFLRRR